MSLKSAWIIAGSIIAAGLFVGAVAVAPVMANHTPRHPQPCGDPIGNYIFRVEVDGVDLGHFRSVEGLSIEQEIIEFSSGEDPSLIRKLPGRVKYGNITLKRGVVSGDSLWEWIQTSFNPSGEVMRKDGTLILEDRRGGEIVRYNFHEAWPAKWKGFELNARANDVAIEEIVLAVESFEEVVEDSE